jgi:formate hydrogenlyase subunit 4
MDTIIHNTVHVLLALTLPPLLLGVINKTKALFAGRVGPPLLQPYYDLIKLFRKGSVFSTTTTWVFRAGPVVGLVTTAMAVLLVPLIPLANATAPTSFTAPISFTGDLILLAYLLGLGRFFTALAALDTGSAFEGMGAAREVTFACLGEPALFLGLLVLAKLSGSLHLADLVVDGKVQFGMLGSSLGSHWPTAGASLALVLLSWFVVLLAENSRIPFDDPNTHLELTMIHEVMVLDHSGPAFGMILYGAAIKLFVFGALIVRLAVPWATGSPWLDWPIFVGGMLVVAAAVGVVESTMARLRMTHVPILLVAACLLSAFGVILVVR